jgi:hypothetical protein
MLLASTPIIIGKFGVIAWFAHEARRQSSLQALSNPLAKRSIEDCFTPKTSPAFGRGLEVSWG